MFDNCIIYLIGFRGTGKYTIAKNLQKKYPFRLVDNHLINNPIFMLHDVNEGITSNMWRDVDQIRKVVFKHIKNENVPSASFIFTNELIEEDDGDKDIYKKVYSIAKDRKAKFFPIRLNCDLKELEKRIQSAERKKKFKDTSLVNIKKLYSQSTLLNPKHKNLIDIDITPMSANKSSQKILEAIKHKIQTSG